MSDIFFTLMAIAMAMTLLSLALGLIVMVKGGDTNKKYGNKLMQLRVIIQGIALALFAAAVLSAK